MLNLTINGQEQILPGPLSVADLLDKLGIDRQRVAVEVNCGIVPRPEHQGPTYWRPAIWSK